MKTRYILIALLFLSHISYAQNGRQGVYHSQSDLSSAQATDHKSGITLRLYPILAQKYVNVYVQAAKPRPFTVAIYDSYNNLIKQWNEGANGSYEKAVDVTAMTNGKYYVKITYAHGTLRQSFTVAH